MFLACAFTEFCAGMGRNRASHSGDLSSYLVPETGKFRKFAVLLSPLNVPDYAGNTFLLYISKTLADYTVLHSRRCHSCLFFISAIIKNYF
jgi:hypothetical protein